MAVIPLPNFAMPTGINPELLALKKALMQEQTPDLVRKMASLSNITPTNPSDIAHITPEVAGVDALGRPLPPPPTPPILAQGQQFRQQQQTQPPTREQLLRGLTQMTGEDVITPQGDLQKLLGEKPVPKPKQQIGVRGMLDEPIYKPDIEIASHKDGVTPKDFATAEEFVEALSKNYTGTDGDYSRTPMDIVEMTENGELDLVAGYDTINKEMWFGKGSKYETPIPKNGKITIYRASQGKGIRAGDYVTQSRKYAQSHLDRTLKGEGTISELNDVGLDELQVVNPNEFWYAPKEFQITKAQLTKDWQDAQGKPQPMPRGQQVADELEIWHEGQVRGLGADSADATDATQLAYRELKDKGFPLKNIKGVAEKYMDLIMENSDMSIEDIWNKAQGKGIAKKLAERGK